jgi:hypothetical protein
MPKGRNDPREWSPIVFADVDNPQQTPGRLHPPWQYILSNPASYPAEIFAQVTLDLTFHPERHSKHIRRADILSDGATEVDYATSTVVDGMDCTQIIRRRLMPRNPNLDSELEQTCRLYVAGGETSPSLVTYYSHYVEEVGVPYYVPDTLGVAFELYNGNVYIAYHLFPGGGCMDDRLKRVALNLLKTIHRHWYAFLEVANVVLEL